MLKAFVERVSEDAPITLSRLLSRRKLACSVPFCSSSFLYDLVPSARYLGDNYELHWGGGFPSSMRLYGLVIPWLQHYTSSDNQGVYRMRKHLGCSHLISVANTLLLSLGMWEVQYQMILAPGKWLCPLSPNVFLWCRGSKGLLSWKHGWFYLRVFGNIGTIVGLFGWSESWPLRVWLTNVNFKWDMDFLVWSVWLQDHRDDSKFWINGYSARNSIFWFVLWTTLRS